MVRDDLCIKVPSFFRCQISLDVMKSPVSLCTGVTYDRTSIQRWLDSGNNTCPATMQVLKSKELVPTAPYNASSRSEQKYRLLVLAPSRFQRGRSIHSRIGSVRIVESIAMDGESNLLIAEKDGLLPELVKSIGLENYPSLIEASLSCLIAISKARRVKVKLVHLKTIPELRNILTADPNTGVSNLITEKALKLLETVSSCKEGRVEMCSDMACIEAVVQKVFKVSVEATEHAVTILWSICYLSRDVNAREAVTNSNGLTKILLLMQSNCSPTVRQMAGDLLKIFRVNSKSCLSSYDTKTTHIMPF
ncbi:hypothetical protein GH714_033954 [Hevea brasiliensis]|uniref:U-box domain-containing protein n=1 Tax=Hevea brasiliensis TaxID=3981 RepID=A0A6A6K9A6_HEVBR|nr:hypothetical protein GH714_033954 [Hevea brasiliensis]